MTNFHPNWRIFNYKISPPPISIFIFSFFLFTWKSILLYIQYKMIDLKTAILVFDEFSILIIEDYNFFNYKTPISIFIFSFFYLEIHLVFIFFLLLGNPFHYITIQNGRFKDCYSNFWRIFILIVEDYNF